MPPINKILSSGEGALWLQEYRPAGRAPDTWWIVDLAGWRPRGSTNCSGSRVKLSTIRQGIGWKVSGRASFKSISGALLRIITAIGLLLLVTEASAQQPVQSLRGVVRGSGSPLAGAEVLVGPRQTVTARDGTFQVDSLRPGTYTLTIRKLGFVPLRSELVVGAAPPAERTYELAPAPVRLPAVVVEGTRAGIYGTIADTSHRPIEGATIDISGDHGGVIRSDSVGRFALPRAGRGLYLLRVTRPGYAEHRIFVELKRGEGREVAFILLPVAGPASRVEDVAVHELGTRLAFGRDRERVTAAQLERYSSLPLCDLPRIAAELGHIKDVPVAVSINAVTIDVHATLSKVCAWRADEVELVEFGLDICQEMTGTLAELANIWCSGHARNIPRSIAGEKQRISTQAPGMRYVIIWEKR